MKPVRPDLFTNLFIASKPNKFGSSFKFEHIKAPPLQLKFLPANNKTVPSGQVNAFQTASRLCENLGMPQTMTSFTVLTAMLSEGLKLDVKLAKGIQQVVSKHKDDPAAARVAAKAAAMSLELDGQELASILSVLNNDSEQHEQNQEEPHTYYAFAENDVESLSIALKKAYSNAINDKVLRAFITRPDAAGWTCLPFDITYNRIRFHGFIRLWAASKAAKASRLVADIRCDDESRVLDIHSLSSGNLSSIAYYSNNKAEQIAFTKLFSHLAPVLTGDINEAYVSELYNYESINEKA